MRRLIVLISRVSVACVVVSQALTAAVPQLPVSLFFSKPGHLTALASGVTYQAKNLPVPIRLAAPDGSWFGA